MTQRGHRFFLWIAPVAMLAAALVGRDALAQQAPPVRHLDDTSVGMWLYNPGGGSETDSGYQFVASLYVFGSGLTSQDAIRIDWIQGGHVLSSHRCVLSVSDDDDTSGSISECRSDGDLIHAVGNVQADIVFLDGQTDAATPLRSLTFAVGRYYEWLGMDDAGHPRHIERNQIMGDDLLASAYVYQRPRVDDRTSGTLDLFFWAALRNETLLPTGDTVFRCGVDGGTMTPIEIQGVRDTIDMNVDDRQFTSAAPDGPTHYSWRRIQLLTRLRWGTSNGQDTETWPVTGDRPGAWVCQVRISGQTVREFHFTVGADGAIAPHAEESGANPLSVYPGTHMIDVRFPDPEGFDFSFHPDLVRRTGFYGRPWTSPAALATLPAAVGLSQPAARTGAGARGSSRTPPARAPRHP